MKKSLLTFLLLVLLLACLACAPLYNKQKTGAGTPAMPAVVQQDDQTLIFVALSGGGTRAAAMSWKVLEEFKKIPYVYIDQAGHEINSTLADEIDYLSGISGGSFAAAAFCLYKDRMDVFRKRFIDRNIERDLFIGLFWPPWQGPRMLYPGSHYDRIHMASELYDREVFEKKTFADLPPHPVLWINATHLALGNRFTFTREYFDLLDSDLAHYPLAYACAASSAFPVLLSPMTLVNYGAPEALSDDVTYKMAKLNARDDIEKDFYCRTRDFYNDKTNRYMHLADGGLVDNQGLQAIIDQFDTNGIINRKLNDRDKPLKRLIIINVNAGVGSDEESCKKESAPGIGSVVEYTMTTSMDILSAKRWMTIKQLADEVYKAAIDLRSSTPSLAKLEKPYTIEINFRNVKDDRIRAACNKLPTSFHLTKEQIELIDSVVPKLVDEDPEMTRLMNALKR